MYLFFSDNSDGCTNFYSITSCWLHFLKIVMKYKLFVIYINILSFVWTIELVLCVVDKVVTLPVKTWAKWTIGFSICDKFIQLSHDSGLVTVITNSNYFSLQTIHHNPHKSYIHFTKSGSVFRIWYIKIASF